MSNQIRNNDYSYYFSTGCNNFVLTMKFAAQVVPHGPFYRLILGSITSNNFPSTSDLGITIDYINNYIVFNEDMICQVNTSMVMATEPTGNYRRFLITSPYNTTSPPLAVEVQVPSPAENAASLGATHRFMKGDTLGFVVRVNSSTDIALNDTDSSVTLVRLS